MATVRKWNWNLLPFCLVGLVSVFLTGCNQSADRSSGSGDHAADASLSENSEHSGTGGSLTTNSSGEDSRLPIITPASSSGRNDGSKIQTASLSRHQEGSKNYNLPASGTPEWDIRQIALLISKEAQAAPPSGENQRNTVLNIVSDETARRIIALATHAISETHHRPEKELIFNAAIQSMMDARLKLALSGEKESLDAIYKDAAMLAKDRPGSQAASIAAGTVINLAKEMAKAGDSTSPWMSEYVKQVKIFATNFSQEEARAIVQLIDAGEFCEQRQLILQAIECYTMMQQQFPDSPFQKKAEAALNRLGLIGKKINFSGPTIDGKTFQISEQAGQPLILVFWSVQSEAFQKDVELLNRLVNEKHYGLVGVNMDRNAEDVKEYITKNQLAGSHIFYLDAASQGASQPMAREFGINTVPTYWYIDQNNHVRATNVTREQLESLLKIE